MKWRKSTGMNVVAWLLLGAALGNAQLALFGEGWLHAVTAIFCAAVLGYNRWVYWRLKRIGWWERL